MKTKAEAKKLMLKKMNKMMRDDAYEPKKGEMKKKMQKNMLRLLRESNRHSITVSSPLKLTVMGKIVRQLMHYLYFWDWFQKIEEKLS